MALLPTWKYQNYKNTVRNESTNEYKEMVNDVRDMLWPHRNKIKDVGGIFTYVPFAKSVSGQDIELQCSIHYDNGQLNMKFQSAYGFCEPMFEVHVSKKLFGLRTESLFDDELYKFSPEYVKTTIKQVVESFTKEEKAEMFREANLKSLPDTFIYDVSMAEHCQMMSDVQDKLAHMSHSFGAAQDVNNLTELADMISQGLSKNKNVIDGVTYGLDDLIQQVENAKLGLDLSNGLNNLKDEELTR